jgi:hypothetical protein
LILGSNSLIGLGVTSNPNVDVNFVTDLVGTNVKKAGGLITLDYYEVEEINQPYATRVESVAPYRVGYYGGTINLTPSSDIWVDVVRLVANTTEVATNYIQSESQITASELDSQSGFGPVTWGSWETVWTGSSAAKDSRTVNVGYYIIKEDLETVTKTGTSTRTGVRKITKDEFKNVSLGDTVLNTDISSYMRSRNIEFVSKRLKPYTRVYTFFNGIDVNKYITPKLLEITMTSGTFQVGETVEGIIPDTAYLLVSSSSSGLGSLQSDPKITFRVSSSNHKYGPYNAPTEVFTGNPYNSSQTIPETYSSTSTILNVDTFSLSQQPQGSFFGFIQTGMKLRGQTSGAEAVVREIKLITDGIGVVIGSFFIPNPNVFGNPRFESGTKLFRVTSSSSNSLIDSTTTSAEEKFYSEGKINRVQENILSVRTVRTETQTISESRSEKLTGPTAVVSTSIVGNTLPPYVPPAPPVVPANPPTQVDYAAEPPVPTYSPIIDTPTDFGFDTGFVPEDFPLPPVPEDTSGTTTTNTNIPTQTRKKGKPGLEFLNLNNRGLVLGVGGNPTKLLTGNQYSVPLQTVNGKTYGELKKKLGQKEATQTFKDAGLKVTKTDKNFSKQSTISKETKQPKGAIPTTTNASSVLGGVQVAKQLTADKLVGGARTSKPSGLVTFTPNAVTNVPANKGKNQSSNKRK